MNESYYNYKSYLSVCLAGWLAGWGGGCTIEYIIIEILIYTAMRAVVVRGEKQNID